MDAYGHDLDTPFFRAESWFDPVGFFADIRKRFRGIRDYGNFADVADSMFQGWYVMLALANDKPPRKVKQSFLRAFRRYLQKKRALMKQQRFLQASAFWHESLWFGAHGLKFVTMPLSDMETYVEQWLLH